MDAEVAHREIARLRADATHHRKMAELKQGFADSRLSFIDAIREDRDAGDIHSEWAAVRIAELDRERAQELDEAAAHRRQAVTLEGRLAALEAVRA